MLERLKKHSFFKDKVSQSLTPMPTQGYCNINYMFQTNTKTYHVREFKLSANRVEEFQVQQQANKLRLAPKPHFLEEEYMVCSYVQGVHKEKLSLGNVRAVALALRRIHGVRLKLPKLVLKEHFNTQTQAVKRALKVIKKKPKTWVLSHNDLNPKNILFHGARLTFLDWEFSSLNDAYFDLAGICVEFSLSPLEERKFLEWYLQKKVLDKSKLMAYKVLYHELREQWFVHNVT